jgi:hypothetical protein
MCSGFSVLLVLKTPDTDTHSDDRHASEDEGKSWNTVLDKYRLTEKSRSRCVSRLLQCVIFPVMTQINEIHKVARNLRKPNIRPLLGSLYTVLSSDRRNDDISGEIAEMVGFDEIDLVMDILNERAAVAHEVGRYVPPTQRFRLIVDMKLEGIVDSTWGPEPSFLTAGAKSHAPGCACCKLLIFSFVY